MNRKPLVGALILIAWLLAPRALGVVLPTSVPSLLALVVWQLFVFPHGITYVRSGFTPSHPHAAWSTSTAVLLASTQWLLVAIAFGWLTRKQRWPLQVALAPLAIALAALAVQWILPWLGYVVFQPIP